MTVDEILKDQYGYTQDEIDEMSDSDKYLLVKQMDYEMLEKESDYEEIPDSALY